MPLAHYQQIPIWENTRRLELLKEFAALLSEYSVQAGPRPLHGDRLETEASSRTRQKMNFIIDEVAEVIDASGVPATMTITPPPMVGGYSRSVHLIHNLFLLDQYRMSLQSPMDAVERAAGVYHRDQRAALWRTFNPFFWAMRLVRYVMHIPFELVRLAGYNTAAVENSWVGKLIKLVVGAVSLLAALVQLGWIKW